MGNNTPRIGSNGPRSSLAELARVFGAIIGVPILIYTIINNYFERPSITIAVALITAILASVYMERYHKAKINSIIITWLALVVVALAVFVVWPKTVTVEGTIVDTTSNPVPNEEVKLIDVNGVVRITNTDKAGCYQFNDVPNRSFKILVRDERVEGLARGGLIQVLTMNLTIDELIQTSTTGDGQADTLPPFSFCQDKGMGGEETVPVTPPRSVKGIIIDLKTRHTFENGEKYGFSLWEVVIYDPDTASNLAIGATVYASSEQDNEDCIKCLAPKAIDGDNNSRWSSGFYEPQWLRIVFNRPQVIHSILLNWQDAYAEAYCITEIK